jgi:hypothetical protein
MAVTPMQYVNLLLTITVVATGLFIGGRGYVQMQHILNMSCLHFTSPLYYTDRISDIRSLLQYSSVRAVYKPRSFYLQYRICYSHSSPTFFLSLVCEYHNLILLIDLLFFKVSPLSRNYSKISFKLRSNVLVILNVNLW